MVSRIRLAWWREALERLDHAPPPAEPVLQALAAHVLPLVSGAELAAMEEGWAALLDEGLLDSESLDRHAACRGGLLFRYSARLLGEAEAAEPAGERWALVDLARHSARDTRHGARGRRVATGHSKMADPTAPARDARRSRAPRHPARAGSV